MTRRTTLVASLLALAISAGPVLAEELQTVKTDNATFTDLTSVATQGKTSLGLRKGGGAPTVEETITVAPQRLSAKQVQKVIDDRMPEVEYCYSKHMRGVNGVSGELALSFAISPKGTTGNIKVEIVGPKGKGLEKCIMQRVKKWRFPAADEITEVTIPLVFSVAGAE